MSRVRDASDLLLLELATQLGAEHAGAGLLRLFLDQASDVQLRSGLARHLAETEQHALSVESALRILGAEPRPSPSAALDGIEREHRAAMSRTGSRGPAAVRDAVVAGSAAHVELYEIGAYEPIVEKAALEREDGIVELLSVCLDEERAALDEARAIAGRLARELP
ncbi:MAG TPA: DUF892 family protein [Gaiellaceae bacterium]|jgi:ferritin-like metal-binding protein YciE